MRELSPLFDIDSVRRFEADAILAAGDVSRLMERAGQAAWQRLLEFWPCAMRIVVVCGPGGNGGDGFVLARLAHESGRDVTVVESAPGDRRHTTAAFARDRYVAAGGALAGSADDLPQADVLVDALLGIGLSGEPRPEIAALVRAINAHPAPVLALDVPSGIDATGAARDAVVAHATVEFLLPKSVLRTGRAAECAGLVTVAALVEPATVAEPVAAALLASADSLAKWLAPRRRDTHKGEQGRVACIGGEIGSGGAVILCAQAALRAGAGLVRVHTRGNHLAPLLMRAPEAMIGDENIGEAEFDWPQAVVLGPGLGQGNWGFEWLHHVLASGLPCVLDADALNLLAKHDLRASARSVLTPHPGEAARLLGCTIEDVQRDRFGALSRLLERHGATVVLKGAGTLVGAPGSTPVVIGAGNPGMATGGMGDVLAGVIGALLGQGMETFDAACCGALLHSAAGDAAAIDGERGMLASDLLPHIRRMANPA